MYVIIFVWIIQNVISAPGVAYVRYQSPKCAAYAKDKLNGFEYPTGYRLSVRYPVVTGASGDGFSRVGYVFSLVILNF